MVAGRMTRKICGENETDGTDDISYIPHPYFKKTGIF